MWAHWRLGSGFSIALAARRLTGGVQLSAETWEPGCSLRGTRALLWPRSWQQQMVVVWGWESEPCPPSSLASLGRWQRTSPCITKVREVFSFFLMVGNTVGPLAKVLFKGTFLWYSAVWALLWSCMGCESPNDKAAAVLLYSWRCYLHWLRVGENGVFWWGFQCRATGQEPDKAAVMRCSSGAGGMLLIAPLYIVMYEELSFGWILLHPCSLNPS